MKQDHLSLENFITQQSVADPQAYENLFNLLSLIGRAGRRIAQDLRSAGLIDVLGTTGALNVQGEIVKKLDVRANEIFIDITYGEECNLVCALASEEMKRPIIFSKRWPQARYMILVDPLDGSSNTDCNMPLGSIFSIVKCKRPDKVLSEEALVNNGTEQVAAGYLLYGSSTLLVYTVGYGVHGFTLDPDRDDYRLSHEDIRLPVRGRIYGVNEGNYHKWEKGMQQYIDSLKIQNTATGRPYSGRYSACLVADIHRILLGGGIYLYPGEQQKPEGKLRLLYEANPMAWVVEQAGGRASTGMLRILDVEAKELHQRVPLIIGSVDDVCEAERYIQGKHK